MKRKKLNIKEIIKKRIENRHGNYDFIPKTTTMNERDKIRVSGSIGNHVLNNLTLDQTEHNIKTILNAEIPIFEDFFSGKFEKKKNVDYDVIICIPSHNRYLKVLRLINQLYCQTTKYTFKIILLNDGSNDIRYCEFENSDIIYLNNKKPHGRENHWRAYGQLWNETRNFECHAILQMDDDFILCSNFLNIIMDKFFIEKEKNNHVLAIAPHTWSFLKKSITHTIEKEVIDGIGLFDFEFIKKIDFRLNVIYFTSTGVGISAGVWTQIINIFKKNGWYVYRTEHSLVWHDGNDDSKLHGAFRKKRSIYTQNFIDGGLEYD